MVDVTPGDSGANKGFWKEQIRDRNGRFARMGGAVTFDIELPGVLGKVRGNGILKDVYDLETVIIEVPDSSKVPKGIYYVKTSDFEMMDAIAILPADYVAEKLGTEIPEAPTPQAAPLKSKMTGSDILRERLRSIASVLKKEGRFPIPRLAFTQSVGKDSDVAKGAKLDYKKVFDAEPALQQKYGSAENMWQKVFQYAVDDRTQSPNTLAEIPEDMKEINRAYAKHVLGLDPDGLITVYRNAINGKETPEESAIGYASLDRNMAYDYNANRPNNFANGRYEIDVKPDEIFGMLGYSKVEDEYGFALGRELTNIPGRVRRVGDLASPAMQAPWLEEAANVYRRNQGSSPFRAFNVLGEFDFHPVEPLGESVDEFFQKYNLSAADIKAKFDQLYGEGAYDRYKASGNSVSFQRIRDLFVKLPDGRIGLDGAKLEKLNVTNVNTAEYRDDLFDNTMKMLSVFQELTGQPFMTHKTREYASPTQERDVSTPTEAKDVVPPGSENWIPILSDLLKQTADADDENNGFDPELGNKRLSIVMEKAGYNAKPKLVSQEEFNSIEGQTIYRGIPDQRFIEQYKSSPKHFAGQGKFGNGTYSTNQRQTAAQYGGGDTNVLEMKMAPDANIQKFESRSEYIDWVNGTLAKFREEYGNSGVSDDEYYDFVGQMDNIVDWTNVAVMLGIDAIEFPPSAGLEERYTIILNRGKVIVNDKP